MTTRREFLAAAAVAAVGAALPAPPPPAPMVEPAARVLTEEMMRQAIDDVWGAPTVTDQILCNQSALNALRAMAEDRRRGRA